MAEASTPAVVSWYTKTLCRDGVVLIVLGIVSVAFGGG
jgi:hypothetical protein